MVTEAICETTDKKVPLYTATLDAFDTISYESLLRKLSWDGFHGWIWALKQDSCIDLTANVYWNGEYSNAFTVRRGTK